MRAEFAGWEPRYVRALHTMLLGRSCAHHIVSLSCRVQKLLALIPSTLDWKLMDRAPLSTWVHSDGKLALLGDSCHPMLVRMHESFPLRDLSLTVFSLLYLAIPSTRVCHGREYPLSVSISILTPPIPHPRENGPRSAYHRWYPISCALGRRRSRPR